MQTGYLDTIIKIELVIVLAHRNSGAYRCCTWFVNLGTPRLKQGARVLSSIFQIMEAETFGAIDQGTQERIERQIGRAS